MKDPISYRRHDPDSLARRCIEGLNGKYPDNPQISTITPLLVRSLFDSIETEDMGLFLNTFQTCRADNFGVRTLVDDILLAIESFIIEWNLKEGEIKSLWQLFHLARGFAQDQKTEGRAADGERNFKEIAELLPQVIFEIDNKGVIRFINKQAYAFLDMKKKISTDLSAALTI